MTARPVPLWQRPLRALVWITDTCDGKGDPSLAKMLALAFGICALHDCFTRGYNTYNLVAAIAVIAAAFGRSVFMNWLDKRSGT